jgi:hypothetical protein
MGEDTMLDALVDVGSFFFRGIFFWLLVLPFVILPLAGKAGMSLPM